LSRNYKFELKNSKENVETSTSRAASKDRGICRDD